MNRTWVFAIIYLITSYTVHSLQSSSQACRVLSPGDVTVWARADGRSSLARAPCHDHMWNVTARWDKYFSACSKAVLYHQDLCYNKAGSLSSSLAYISLNYVSIYLSMGEILKGKEEIILCSFNAQHFQTDPQLTLLWSSIQFDLMLVKLEGQCQVLINS